LNAPPRCTVLVVDDDEDIRETVVQVLEEEGYRTLSAEHGAEALEVLRREEHPPALILLDLMMPVMDGTAFRASQLADPRLAGIPVIVVSAYTDLAEKAKTMGSVQTLKKPLQLQTLMTAIRTVCPPATH
jgi:CheY-like chemotaxis protein